MSTTIKSIYGMQWKISKPTSDSDGSPEVAIDTLGNKGNRIFKVADVLDAMRAEGVIDAIEIITELPEVEESPGGNRLYVDGNAYGTDGAWADGGRHREAALRSLALARFCEARHAAKVDEREAAEAVLAERRNEVADKIGAYPYYDGLVESAQRSIDLIIELEDQLAAK